MNRYTFFSIILFLFSLFVAANVYADTFSENMWMCQQKCEKQKVNKDPCCVKRCAYYACIDHNSTVKTRGGQDVVDPAARNAAVAVCSPHMDVLQKCVKEELKKKEGEEGAERGKGNLFHNPVFGGKRLDWCYVWASGCGERAATEFCRKKGFKKAASWSMARDIGLSTPTYVIGSGQICDKSFCDGFSSIKCE